MEFEPLKHVVLENYKSIKRLEVNLQTNLNVIIGENGTGKTNILRAIINKANLYNKVKHRRCLDLLYTSIEERYEYCYRNSRDWAIDIYPKTRADYIKYHINQQPTSIVVIEQPELGLHPKSINDLILYLRYISRNRQIIFTTNSPQMVNMLHINESQNLYIATFDNENGTQLKQLNLEEITERDWRASVLTTNRTGYSELPIQQPT